MADSLEAKQQYLRSEIIDQGYNAEEFSNYMASLREDNSLDLELWSFSDLQTVVSQYKSLVAQNQQQEQQQSVQQTNEQQNEVQNEETKNENENNNNPQEVPEENVAKDTASEKSQQNNANAKNGFPNDPFENYEQIIKAEKLENNEITDQNNLYVTVTNPTKVNKGLFYPSYYQYTLQTSPVGYTAVRKGDDFKFLYDILPMFNSGVFNPTLPHFEFKLKDDSPKKLLYLKNYINSLLESKYFRTLPIIYEFLTLPQEQWNKKRDNYAKLKQHLPLPKMSTLEGEFHIKINKADDERGNKIKDEIIKRQEAYDQLNNAMDELLVAIEKVSLCYNLVAKSLNDLTKTHQDNNKTLSGLFTRLSNLSKTWARDCIRQRDYLRDEIKYYFKFMNKENVSFLKKYDEFKAARDEYKSKYEKVKKQPVKVQRDIDLVQRFRRDYGFQLIMLNSEYEKLLERQAERSFTQFLKYNDNKNILLQNYNNCIKLFNINEDPNNIEGEQQHPPNQEQEQAQDPEQQKDEMVNQTGE